MPENARNNKLVERVCQGSPQARYLLIMTKIAATKYTCFVCKIDSPWYF